MATDDSQKEQKDNYVGNETKKAALVSTGIGAIVGGGAGLAIGAEVGAAFAIGGSIISAPVAIPAMIGATAIGLIGTGIANVIAKNKKISTLEKQGLKKSLEGVHLRLLATKKQMEQYKNEQKEQQEKKDKILKAMEITKKHMEEQEVEFKKQVKEQGYARNPLQFIMVMIGEAGHGKSTLGNRICGDRSTKGKKGPFTVSAAKDKAGTTDPKSVITIEPFEGITSDEGTVNNVTDVTEENEVKLDEVEMKKDRPSLLIVDTPGWGDVNEANRDDHKNKVVQYLKGCGGINSFMMVISDSDRIDLTIQQMLSEYEQLFGVEFWNHLTIVMTRIDDEDDLEDFKKNKHESKTQKTLKKKCEHLNKLNRDIPVIPIGKKIYEKQIPLIIQTLSTKKFECDALKGPYEKLKEKYDGLKLDLQAVDHKLAQTQENITNTREKIEKLEAEIGDLQNKLNK